MSQSYTVKVSGWELNGSAHSLTKEQVKQLKDYQEEMGIEDLNDIGFGLEDVIEDYYPFDTNMWVISKPFEIPNNTYFTVDNENDVTVLEFPLSKIESRNEDNDPLFEYPESHQGYPMEDNNEDILLFMEENKGLVCEFKFYSNEPPKLEDFTYVPNFVETPDGDWEYIETLYFKNKELEMSYEEQWVRGKALTVELWSLSDL